MSLPFPAAVIQAVLNAGVGEFVICAGARNSALVVVLAALGDKVRLWQHFDERAAGFFAIGRIRATGKPVAVVTTSGTAVAELLPAVIEAHYQGLPLVALTADRPKCYRGSGAPQAIEQAGLFGNYVVECFDADSLVPDFSNWSWDAPIHLNVCLEELAVGSPTAMREAAGDLNPMTRDSPRKIFPEDFIYDALPASAHKAVIVGELLPSEIEGAALLVAGFAAPIFAEAASGLRDLPELSSLMLRCGEGSLRHLPVTQLLRVGGVPSSRYWRDLEDRMNTVVMHCSRSGFPGLARAQDVVEFWTGQGNFDLEEDFIPLGNFLARDAALYARLGVILTQFPNSEPALFRRLSQVIPQGATVFTGNSLAVREWNLCAEYGRGHRVHVLRGANGIDGNLSAFLGIAADKEEAWCVTGDLTALYDLSAPWMLPQLSAGRRRFVVIQNGGGKIFSRLPSLRGLNDRERTLMENPHNISLRGWAEMWSMDHVTGGGEILDELSALADHAVIELHPDSEQTEAFWQAWAEAEKEVWA